MDYGKVLLWVVVFGVMAGLAWGDTIIDDDLIYTNANLSVGYITSNLIPYTTNAQDLGSNSNQFKDAYIDGALYCDALGENLDADSNDITGVGTLAATTLTQDSESVWDYTGGVTYANMSFSNNIVAGDIATDAVETAEIKDGEVQTADIAGANVTDAKIDFANSVDMDDLSDGSTNAAVTLTQETNWDAHLSDNTQAHTDYLLNSGADETSGKLTMAGADMGSVGITNVGVLSDDVSIPIKPNGDADDYLISTTQTNIPMITAVQDDAYNLTTAWSGLSFRVTLGHPQETANPLTFARTAGAFISVYGDGLSGTPANNVINIGHTGGGGHGSIATAAGDIVFAPASNHVLPSSDNADDLGSSTQAWKDIYYEGSITDTSPTFSGEEIKALTGKTPKQLLKQIKHNPDGHINKSTVPDFLKPCKSYNPIRESFRYELISCENKFNGEELVETCRNETKYTTTQKEDVLLCNEFGDGLKIGEYANLAFLALQEVEKKQEELEDRLKVLEAQLGI